MLKRVHDCTSEDYSHLMDTNLESPFHLTQLSYPLLKASEMGNVVFISSVAGGTALPGLAIYSATKGNQFYLPDFLFFFIHHFSNPFSYIYYFLRCYKSINKEFSMRMGKG